MMCIFHFYYFHNKYFTITYTSFYSSHIPGKLIKFNKFTKILKKGKLNDMWNLFVKRFKLTLKPIIDRISLHSVHNTFKT